MPLVVSYNGKVLVFQQFQAALPPIWGFGAQHGGAVGFAVDLSQNFFGSGGGVRGTYPAYPPGDVFVWGGYNIAAQNSSDIAIRFRAKMPGAKQGFKFIKVFGGNGGVNGSANTTFGLDYTGVDYGSMYCTSFGDGTSAANDTQNVIFFDGTYPSWIGRSYGTAVVQTPMHKRFRSSDWGTGWHKFELYVKFNSGTTAQNEMADGAYVVKIDDQVYVNAKGLFNRHYTNPPIDRVELFGWAQNTQQPFEIWYDNVEVSVGGFGNSPI